MADRFYRVSLGFHTPVYAGVTGFSVFGHSDFGSTDYHASDLASKIGGDATLEGKISAASSGLVTWDGVTVRELLEHGDTSVPDEAFHAWGWGGLLTHGSHDVPDECTLILSMKTNAAVRSGHGYMAWPTSWDSTYCVGSLWDTASAMWTAIGDLIAQLNHYNPGGSAWGSGEHWGTGVYSRTRRARGDAQFAFGCTGYLPRTKVRWRESRQA